MDHLFIIQPPPQQQHNKKYTLTLTRTPLRTRVCVLYMSVYSKYQPLARAVPSAPCQSNSIVEPNENSRYTKLISILFYFVPLFNLVSLFYWRHRPTRSFPATRKTKETKGRLFPIESIEQDQGIPHTYHQRQQKATSKQQADQTRLYTGAIVSSAIKNKKTTKQELCLSISTKASAPQNNIRPFATTLFSPTQIPCPRAF